MWCEVRYDSAEHASTVILHGTPLETPMEPGTNRGLPSAARLYELDYVPCPTPDSSLAGGDRFARDLFTANDELAKNTARWRIVVPGAALSEVLSPTVGGSIPVSADFPMRAETRIGEDLTTGVKWPTANDPQNLSVTYQYVANDVASIPFSERYQFLGDPRHCPYTDLDRHGDTSSNGYNWYWDDLNGNGRLATDWLALDGDPARIRTGWMGNRGGSMDVPRLLSWLRYALVRNEAVYTTLTGFSYYYLSVGGDIGYDSANGFSNSIPMDGMPFGMSGDVYENTITNGGGTNQIKGSLKYVRSCHGSAAAYRSGGYWCSKPWIGELFPDEAYAGQWAPWGNLRAALGAAPLTYKLIRRGDVVAAQQPAGTKMVNAFGRLSTEGCVSLFNIGTTGSTFHHQFASGTGALVEDGPQLATEYNFPLPVTARISRPFGLAMSYSGGVGNEFGFTTEYPRFSAQMVRRFYNHNIGTTGSGLVRLQEPGANPRGGYIVVNGIDRTTETGSAFISKYSLLTLIHSYFAGGLAGPNRIPQVPRIEIKQPTILTELPNPASISVQWKTQWTRWDEKPYTHSYPDPFTLESDASLLYVLMYSVDGGDVWRNMRDGSVAVLGELPRDAATGAPDMARVLSDVNTGGDEAWVWNTPAASFPAGSYLIRIETYRATEPLHYAQHMEKIYVDR